jgi:hypothetical protein
MTLRKDPTEEETRQSLEFTQTGSPCCPETSWKHLVYRGQWVESYKEDGFSGRKNYAFN